MDHITCDPQRVITGVSISDGGGLVDTTFSDNFLGQFLHTYTHSTS